MHDRVFRKVLLALLLGFGAATAGGCGSSGDGTMIEPDVEQEQALTESMRGYYEENP